MRGLARLRRAAARLLRAARGDVRARPPMPPRRAGCAVPGMPRNAHGVPARCMECVCWRVIGPSSDMGTCMLKGFLSRGSARGCGEWRGR